MSHITALPFLLKPIFLLSCIQGFKALRYTGSIKSFQQDTGYGFISCAETFERFQRDVFLHHKQLNGFKARPFPLPLGLFSRSFQSDIICLWLLLLVLLLLVLIYYYY